MNNFRKTFQVICKKNVFVIIMLVLSCPMLAVSYSAFVKSTSNYRASEMYIGKLLYSIRVNGNLGNQATVPANSEVEVTVEVTSLNAVTSNYKLVYQNNPNLIVRYANDDNDMVSSGLITTTRTSTISIENNSSSSQTVIFDAMGGYATNDLSEVIIAAEYTEVSGDYIRYDYKGILLYVDNVSVNQLDPSKNYELASYNCSNDIVPEWNNSSRKIILHNATNQTTCTLNFVETSGLWYDTVLLNIRTNYLTTKMLTAETPYPDNISSPNVTASSGINFAAVNSDTNGKGLYYTTDTNDTQDGSRVYYYRGNVNNNHVLFADFCFRIVRTNEDGSIRLRYNGTATGGVCPQKGADVNIGNTAFNSSFNNNKYAGYMYGNTCTSYATCHANEVNSTMKNRIDDWYQSNIGSVPEYDSKVVMSNFCNDRSLKSGTGVGTVNTNYNPDTRRTGTPTYKCPQGNDIFSLKAGLITIDDALFAGASASTVNSNFYLYTGTNSWTMSPLYLDSTYIRLAMIQSDGKIYRNTSNALQAVQPILSLKSNVQVSGGTGAHDNPYVISTGGAAGPDGSNWYEQSELNNSPNKLTTKMLTSEVAHADNRASTFVTSPTGINFSDQNSNINGKGLYYTTDANDTQDGSRIYYYRGNIDNNHVIFAGFCWRIVRTNEDGSTRMRYNGTPTDGVCPQKGAVHTHATYVKNGTTISGENVAFNDNNMTGQIGSNKNIGYMNGNICNSNSSYSTCHLNEETSDAKIWLEDWYSHTIGTNSVDDSKVATTIFCNDRSLATDADAKVLVYNSSFTNGNGVGMNETYYAPMARTRNGTPTYKCVQKNDIFRSKVGLLTSDEVIFAGGMRRLNEESQNNAYYLYVQGDYWTMSPAYVMSSGRPLVMFVSERGMSYWINTSYAYSSMFPVISLKESTLVTGGTGMYNDPWTI